jgi:hypothetical protein
MFETAYPLHDFCSAGGKLFTKKNLPRGRLSPEASFFQIDFDPEGKVRLPGEYFDR